MRLRNFFFAVVAGAAVAVGLAVALNMGGRAIEPLRATLLPVGNALPEFALLDQDGNAIDRSVFEGQWDFVFFGFTNCPDICPMTMQLLRQVKQQLAANGHEPLPRIVLVSVDPERDTPEHMNRYVSLFGDGNLGITGELDEIRKLTSALGIYFEKAEADNGNYSVDHTAVVLIIDPKGHFRALFSSPHRVEDYIHDLPLIMARK